MSDRNGGKGFSTWLWAIVCTAVLMLAAIPPVLSLDAQQPFSSYAHDQWGTSEGLPFPGGALLAQDGDGYLWIGSMAGLTRFDGQHFTTFDHHNTPVLGGNLIHSLVADHLGRLWIGTERGVVLYDRGSFTAIDTVVGTSVFVLGQTGDQQMLLSDATAVYAVDPGLQVRRWLDIPDVSAMAEHDSVRWLSAGNRVHRIDGDKQQEQTPPGLEQGIAHGFSIHDGKLWLSSSAGLFFLEQAHWRRHPDPRLDGRVGDGYTDSDGNLWIRRERQLIRMYGSEIAEVIDISGYANSPRDMLEDRQGNLWLVSHLSGLHRFWKGVGSHTSLHGSIAQGNYLWAVEVWQDRLITAGSFGVAREQDGKWVPLPDTGHIADIYALRAEWDWLWLGTIRGVYRYHRDGRLEAPAALASISDTRTNTFLRDRQGRLWLGTTRGLYRLDPDQRLQRISGSADQRIRQQQPVGDPHPAADPQWPLLCRRQHRLVRGHRQWPAPGRASRPWSGRAGHP